MATLQKPGGQSQKGSTTDPPTQQGPARQWFLRTRILLILTGAATTAGSIVFGEGKLSVVTVSGIAAGLALLALAGLLSRGKPWMRPAAILVAGFRLVFNGYKVVFVGEASSLIFVVLFTALLILVNVPTGRRFFDRHRAATSSGRT